MGTLYLVGAPAGDPDDLTLRARRILSEVSIIVADDVTQAQLLLAHHDISTPLIATTSLDTALTGLETDDISLLIPGWAPVPCGDSFSLVRAAIERGLPVIPLPGSTLSITALVISGLPADSFVHLGELPQQIAPRRRILASIATEHRTLVAQELAGRLPDTLADLYGALGDRPLVVVLATSQGTEAIWRGRLGEPMEHLPEPAGATPYALVIGGARKKRRRWNEDRLRAEIRTYLDRGFGAKEISHKLTARSGWARREVYHLAVEESKLHAED